MTLFFRLLEEKNKAAALREALAGSPASFEVNPATFKQVPGSPFAYWVRDSVRELFSKRERDGQQFKPWVGLQTNLDFRWLRLSWEVKPEKTRRDSWVPIAKGGEYAPYYHDLHLVVAWKNNGHLLKQWKSEELRFGRITANNSKCWNEDKYFRPGLTWPSRTQSGLCLRAMPAGCIFGHKGPAAFVDGDDQPHLVALLAIMNSLPFTRLVELQMCFGSYEVGVIQRTPVPDLSATDCIALAALARRAWSLKRTLDTVVETSHAFVLPSALLARVKPGSFDPVAIESQIAGIQREIDNAAFRLYGIRGEDRSAMEAVGRGQGAPESSAGEAEAEEAQDDANNEATSDATVDVLSWAVGVAFGRFDVRLATGERALPVEPEPFDPLPERSPGMVTEAPVLTPLAVLADDPGARGDLGAAVTAILERVNLPVREDLRGWLAMGFFPLHIRRYSKSRRKAPIYWQIATASASASVWLYYPRVTKDTLYGVQNDVLGPRLRHEESLLNQLRQAHGPSPTAEQRKAAAAQETFVEELRTLLEEVKRVAPLFDPDLDDGAIINFAPLWRLVPQCKPWQQECRACWEEVGAGVYDWSRLAMRLFPERVVPKCHADRSLAIAHGLEAELWEETAEKKWKPRAVAAARISALVRERTSVAVKAALKSLEEAPAAGGSGKRGRKARTKGGGT